MKNTSVTPSATFDQIPRPSQSAKIGASTTRGSPLTPLPTGSTTAATRGCCANQKPIRIPATEPMTKASTDSTSVIQRCFQIVPSTNHLTMRAATSAGVEKKNGGRSFTPPMGTVVKSCPSSTPASGRESGGARSFNRDRAKLGFATSWPCLARPSTSLFETLSHGRNSSGHDGQGSLRLRERSDDAGRALGVPVQRLDELVARQ